MGEGDDLETRRSEDEVPHTQNEVPKTQRPEDEVPFRKVGFTTVRTMERCIKNETCNAACWG